ncbi:11552_t:CDS:2, partial [Funneliformis geosporum]
SLPYLLAVNQATGNPNAHRGLKDLQKMIAGKMTPFHLKHSHTNYFANMLIYGLCFVIDNEIKPIPLQHVVVKANIVDMIAEGS